MRNETEGLLFGTVVTIVWCICGKVRRKNERGIETEARCGECMCGKVN